MLAILGPTAEVCAGTVMTPSLVSYMMTLAQHIPCHSLPFVSIHILLLKISCEVGVKR